MPTSHGSFHLGHPKEAEITPLTCMGQLRQVWGPRVDGPQHHLCLVCMAPVKKMSDISNV